MEPNDSLIQHARPELRSPILIVAFRGWNDAGESATFAASHLGKVWAAESMAEIDPEEFYDFQAVRPQVELANAFTRNVIWPSNEFLFAHLDNDRDVILLIGTEPSLRWRTFNKVVTDFAKANDVSLVVTFGALLADVPHSRPVHITGYAGDPNIVERFGLSRPRYEGPTGIVGVLHDACSKVGIPSLSLWAAVPHYLAITPNPKAALALVEKCSEMIEVPAGTTELEHAAESYEERVADMIESDEDVQAYVRLLEERNDGRDDEEDDPIDTTNLPSGDSLAAELEKFLRERDVD
jgi:predicted ATP-grasp superfamily ATP-dependent carboligase